MEKAKEIISEPMRKFIHFYETIKGKRDVKSRASVMSNPDNLKTMSILTRTEAEFVSESCWLGDTWGFFEPLKEYAHEKLETNISIAGKGREQIIQFMGALSESKLLSKLGITMKGEEKK